MFSADDETSADLGPATAEWLSQLLPEWVRPAFWGLAAAGVALLGVSLATTVTETSAGFAIIRTPGRIDLTSRSGGIVDSIAVQSGEVVSEGQVLVRFSPATELAELEATQHEFNEYLSRLLYDPSDSAARQTAAMLNSRKLLSMASVSQLEVRAPKAGVVGDVRIHVGQNLAAGDVVLALLPDERTYSVMALLPARDAAFLKPGQAIDFELDGYPFAPQRAAIEFRTDLPISPEEARRFLGPSVSDTFTLDEPMVIVEALLPTNRFRADGRELPLHDGMLGRARVELRSRRTLGAFFPALRVAEAP